MAKANPPILQSIRQALIGAVTDFVIAAGFGHHEIQIVVELVYLLSEYREEEVPLFPDVYLIESNSDVLAAIAPGMERLALGEISTEGDVANRVLKDCATLAIGGWSIYLEPSNGKIRYGLFRAFDFPFAISASESLSDPESESGAALLIRNCSARCVELIAGTGDRMELSLTSVPAPKSSVAEAISRLASVAVSAAAPEARTSLQAYFVRILTEICRKTHGTMIAVVPHDLQELPLEFRDGVVLPEPLEFGQSAASLAASGDAPSLARLQSRESLLRGMISSDGITILGTNASVRAFRVFVKPNATELAAIDSLGLRGGARSRAFALLKLRIGNPLTCAFFRSQDGRTDCVVNDA